jgi:hypothetical protein
MEAGSRAAGSCSHLSARDRYCVYTETFVGLTNLARGGKPNHDSAAPSARAPAANQRQLQQRREASDVVDRVDFWRMVITISL